MTNAEASRREAARESVREALRRVLIEVGLGQQDSKQQEVSHG